MAYNKSNANFLVCGPRSRSTRRARHEPVLSQHTRQWPLQAVEGSPPAGCLAVVQGCSQAAANGLAEPGCTGRQVIRHHVDCEGVGYAERGGDRSRGGDNAPAALKDYGRHCSDGARAGVDVVLKPSLGPFPVALRERDAVTDDHAPWAPGNRPLAAGEALNRSPLPSESKERCFPCSGSIRHPAVPLQGRRGVSQIRTHPYTPTCARVCEPFRQAARHRSVKSGSRWRATPCSAHRAVRRISSIFQSRKDGGGNPAYRHAAPQGRRSGCGSGGRFAQDLGYRFMGWNVGSRGHGVLHLRERWVAGREQARS